MVKTGHQHRRQVGARESRAYRPTGTLLDLFAVTHVHKTTAGLTGNFVFGVEFRVVDMSGDEVSDDAWHAVYQERTVNKVLDSGREGETYIEYQGKRRSF